LPTEFIPKEKNEQIDKLYIVLKSLGLVRIYHTVAIIRNAATGKRFILSGGTE